MYEYDINDFDWLFFSTKIENVSILVFAIKTTILLDISNRIVVDAYQAYLVKLELLIRYRYCYSYM